MNHVLQVAMIIAMIFYFVCLMTLLHKKKVTLKYIMLWLFTGVVLLLVALFPIILKVPLQHLGIVEFTNGIFALLFFFLIIIIMSMTTVISDMSEKQRDIVQKMAIYEYRIRKLEKEQD